MSVDAEYPTLLMKRVEVRLLFFDAELGQLVSHFA